MLRAFYSGGFWGRFQFLICFSSIIITLLACGGCGGGTGESDNPDDQIGITGTVASSAPVLQTAPGLFAAPEGGPAEALYASASGNAPVPEIGPGGKALRAIAYEGDQVFLYLDGAPATSSQITGGKYSFYGGYKGKKIGLRFGLTNNDVYAGYIDPAATGDIVLPAFDEYAVITAKVIETQVAEGRVKLENIVLSSPKRVDLTSIINKVKSVLADKFVKEPDIYGSTMSQTFLKVKTGDIDSATAFSGKKFDVFDPLPQVFLLYPLTATLGRGESVQFTVSMTNFVDKSVIFKIDDKIVDTAGGSSGYIGPAGTYTAPDILDNQKMVTITAQSVENTTKTASATVTLTPVTVILNNADPVVTLTRFDQNYVMPSRVSGHTNKLLKWYVNDILSGDALTVGYVSSNGTYTKPVKKPSVKVFVKAVSVADPTKYGVCEILWASDTNN